MADRENRPQIGVGYRLGKLTVAAPTEKRKNGYIVWRCKCDCGGEILLDTRCLQRGTVTDCGCSSKVKPGQKDLTGRRFGKLICLEPTDRRGPGGGVVWRCRCDCGNECLAVSTQLLHGYKKSCGCLNSATPQDLTGQVFGQLTVLGRDHWKNGSAYWRCRCSCGKETVVRHAYLISGHTKSCGCLQRKQIKDNLRLVQGTSVTILEAMKDRVIASNTSGYNGVYQEKRTGKWRAQITFKGKTYYLGAYDKIEDAIRARQEGERLHEDFLEWYHQNYGA